MEGNSADSASPTSSPGAGRRALPIVPRNKNLLVKKTRSNTTSSVSAVCRRALLFFFCFFSFFFG
jgi:hypothetical protein